MTWCTYLQSFRENTAMRFRVTVRKLNVTDGQTDGWTGAFQYLPSRAFGTAGDNINNNTSTIQILTLIIIWSRDTRLTILIIFRGWISQDNLSVARDRNNRSVLILNLLWIRDVIIYNLMTLHSYHNTCGNIWKITGQFTQDKCSASKVCQWIFSNSFYKLT